MTAEQETTSPAVRRWEWPDWMEPMVAEWPRFPRLFEALKVEEFSEGDAAVVRAEMPGIDPDRDVEITVSDHALRIHAERHSETKHEDARGYRSEFRYGSFTRSVPLPAGANANDIKATYKSGVLEVRVPIDVANAEKTRIPVARG